MPPPVDELATRLDLDRIGRQIHRLIAELHPFCRSLTGEGVRRTLRALQERIDLAIHEVPSGTRVFDWTVPREWNICDAYVKNRHGERVIDFRASNLHVVGYSTAVRARLCLAELMPHLHTLPDHPDWIPYRTSYYTEKWGFCLGHRKLLELVDDEYEVMIDATLADGSLTYGELFLAGTSTDEILIHTHVCHPSLCNDNLSGIAVSTFLAASLAEASRRYSYRFLFLPGTIGAITWLALNEERLPGIRHGLVLSNLGDPGGLTYKRSRRGDAAIDRAASHVLGHWAPPGRVVGFMPYGYDERQYCSPGIDLPVGALSRTTYGQFLQYHTSADDLDFVRPECLANSLAVGLAILGVLEGDRRYRNRNPKCEPQLGRRGLYGGVGGSKEAPVPQLPLLWVLNLSDGDHSLLDIAERADLPFADIQRAAAALAATELLDEVDGDDRASQSPGRHTMNALPGNGPNVDFWRGRTALVTGAAGLLGCWTVRHLLDAGARVVCLMRQLAHKLEQVVGPPVQQCVVVAGDVRDAHLLDRTLAENGVAIVFHLAAQTLAPAAFRDPIATFETNVAGTWQVLDACRRNARLEAMVVASSYNVYGEQPRAPYTEDMPFRGRLPYDVSKACTDLLASSYAATYGLRVAASRCCNLYGPGDPAWKYIIPGTIRSILNGERPLIRSDGRFVRDYLFVEDAALAHLLLAERLAAVPALAGEAFNFCPETPISVLDLVDRILALVPSSLEPVVLGEPIDEPLEKYASADKAHRMLGWRPQFTLDEGLRQTILWCQNELGR